MVIKAANQPDDVMLGHASDLDFPASTLLAQDAFGVGASMWRTTTRSVPEIGFWIGDVVASTEKVEIYAYLMLRHATLGGRPVLEAKKGWTEDAWRRKGLGSALLREAAKIAPLQSDDDGMTSMAFAQWKSVSGFTRRWWDAQEARFVEDAAVPPGDQLTPFENGRRWIIVLETLGKTTRSASRSSSASAQALGFFAFFLAAAFFAAGFFGSKAIRSSKNLAPAGSFDATCCVRSRTPWTLINGCSSSMHALIKTRSITLMDDLATCPGNALNTPGIT